MKVSKALKTAQPAINALLQAKIELAEKKDIDLFLEVRSDIKNIPLEPWNLCKVLANIIDNSITALTEMDKKKDKSKSIHIEIGEDHYHYTFLIYNNGPEIPENQINDIFKQGFTTKKEQEHGMGLYIVSKIVWEVGGTIKAFSNKDKTSFYLEIPKSIRIK
jgi:sensor histidine kinase regulating citrate/malate metabolism